jgi:hypothetical protein
MIPCLIKKGKTYSFAMFFWIYLLSYPFYAPAESLLFSNGERLVPEHVEKAIIDTVKAEIEKVVSTNAFWIDDLSFQFCSAQEIFNGSISFFPREGGGAKEVSAIFYTPNRSWVDKGVGVCAKNLLVITDFLLFVFKEETDLCGVSNLKLSWSATNEKNEYYKGYIQINPDGSIKESFFGTL